MIGAALEFASERGVKTWVVDTTEARGVLLPAVQQYLVSDLAAAMAAHGVVQSFNVMPESALATMAVKRFSQIDTAFENNFVASLDEVMARLDASPAEATA